MVLTAYHVMTNQCMVKNLFRWAYNECHSADELNNLKTDMFLLAGLYALFEIPTGDKLINLKLSGREFDDYGISTMLKLP